MRKFLTVFILGLILSSTIGIFFIVQSKKYVKEDNISEMYNTKQYNIEVLYERIGLDKGIYNFNMLNSKNDKVYNLLFHPVYLDKGIAVFYKEKLGIYISREVNKYDELILEEFTPIGKGERFNDEIVFIANSKENNKFLCSYNISTKKIETKNINIPGNEVVGEVDFVDSTSFLYSKKVSSGDTDVYSYNINSDQIPKLIKSKILSPVSSNDKTKTAYIKKDSGVYNLYIHNNLSKTDIKVNLENGVVKGSIEFSPNDKYIICITLNNNYENVLNIIDLEIDSIHSIKNIYQAIFANNDDIIVSTYDSDKNIQYIDLINIETKERTNIHSFNESGSFSRSVNLIKAIIP